MVQIIVTNLLVHFGGKLRLYFQNNVCFHILYQVGYKTWIFEITIMKLTPGHFKLYKKSSFG